MRMDKETTGPQVIIIEPSRRLSSLGLQDIWEYRDLLFYLLWREIKGRYCQMALGPLWMIIAPLGQMIIYSVLLGVLARLPSEGVPYALFTYAGLLPWQFFATTTRQTADSLVNQRAVIAKVYFPRLIIPLVSVLTGLVDFFASLVVLAIMMLFFRVAPGWTFVTLPFFLIGATMLGLGIGLWLACLNVKFRDTAIGLGFFLEALRFLTPVVYASSIIPDRWQTLYHLNPLTPLVEGFRWALLGVGAGPDWTAAWAALIALLVLLSGAFYFRRTERTIVDIL
jgi:lipopolysaccharide transport system permease protein